MKNNTKTNVLFCEFLELPSTNNVNAMDDRKHYRYDGVSGYWTRYDELRFGTEFNWIMPVVLKIESLNEGKEYLIDILGNSAKLINKKNNVIIFEKKAETKLQATYDLCEEFLNIIFEFTPSIPTELELDPGPFWNQD